MRFASVLALVSLSGCTLYFGDGDDEPCGPPPPSADIAPAYEVRDPWTGECYGYGGGGGCYLDEDTCTYACPEYGSDDKPRPGGSAPSGGSGGGSGEDQVNPLAPLPQGAACYSSCTGLSESECRQTADCQAAYDQTGVVESFRGCWATDVNVPSASGSCSTLDAYSCSTRDDCTMNYSYSYAKTEPTDSYEPLRFSYCGLEQGGWTCEATTCAPGYTCVDACAFPEDPSMGGVVCTPTCVPDVPTCSATTCGPGYECVETCDDTPDAPMGGGALCEATCVPTTACEMLADEDACSARGDCTSVFEGEDCTCYEGGYCECATLTWTRCDSYGVHPF